MANFWRKYTKKRDDPETWPQGNKQRYGRFETGPFTAYRKSKKGMNHLGEFRNSRSDREEMSDVIAQNTHYRKFTVEVSKVYNSSAGGYLTKFKLYGHE